MAGGACSGGVARTAAACAPANKSFERQMGLVKYLSTVRDTRVIREWEAQAHLLPQVVRDEGGDEGVAFAVEMDTIKHEVHLPRGGTGSRVRRASSTWWHGK